MARLLKAVVFASAILLVQLDIGYSALVPLYRYWNGRDHFYTTNLDDIGTAIPGHLGKHGYTSEGVTGRIHNTQVPGSVPLYRYWNGHNHFYTTNAKEIGTTVPGVRGNFGYVSEGITGYCFSQQKCNEPGADVPLYRAFNGGIGDHFYSASVDHIVQAQPHGWVFEGIQCYIGRP